MAIGRLLAVLVFAVAFVAAAPLKKEVLNLPPLIHFSDIFNTHSDVVDDKLTEYSGNSLNRPNPQQPSYTYPPNSGYPIYPQPGYSQPGYPQAGYPQTPYPPIEYPQIVYPAYVPISYPYPQPSSKYPPYPPYPQMPPYPQYPPYPPTYSIYPYRQQDVDIVERYWKFNDDGSKEYKLVMSNGLNIYQKVLNNAGDMDNIQFIEGYYSDKRDDNTFLNTYFSATNNGYSASSEISNSQPSYPDTKEMLTYQPTLSHRKTRT